MNRIEVRSSGEFRSLCKQLGYRRKKLHVIAVDSVTLTDLNWCEGTRNTYHAMVLETGELKTASQLSVPHPMDNEMEGVRVALIPDHVIIRTGFFCGKESLMTIYVHPNNMPKFLGES